MKILKAIWRVLRSNLVLKIMALLFAVILWSYVLAETNPVRERVIKDVAVRPDNMEDLSVKNLAILGNLSEILGEVDIRIEINQQEVKYLSKENVRPYIDLSSITGPGEHILKIKVDNQYGKVREINPSEVTLIVDNAGANPIPVSVNITGNPPIGYYAEEPEIIPNVVHIEGASEAVAKVSSAVCNIDLTGLTEGYNKSVEVVLLDDNGQPVDSSLFNNSVPAVIVKLDVLAKKSVPIDVNSAILGQDDLAPGYEITNIRIEPENIDIGGKKEVLDSIRKMQLIPFTVSGANSDKVAMLDFEPVEGVRVLSDDKVQVYISIREIHEAKTFENIPIQVKNITAGYEVKISQQKTNVTVLAGITKISKLDRSDIVPYVDVEGLESGEYNLPVIFELSDGFTADNFTPGYATVSVTVSKK